MSKHDQGAFALPSAHHDELHDCLVLALDATEKKGGYTQAEREARSLIRRELRLIGEAA